MASYKGQITLVKVEDGIPGADGQDSQKFRIETNQDEILKFYENSEEIFSPNNFIFSIYESVPSLEMGEKQIVMPEDFSLIPEDCKIKDIELKAIQADGVATSFLLSEAQLISNEENKENKVSVWDENGTESKIDFYRDYYSISNNSLVFNLPLFLAFKGRYDEYLFHNPLDPNSVETNIDKELEFAKILESGESILKIKAYLKDEEENYVVERFIKIRYGISSDMAKLSLNAADIHASIQSTALNFSADGLEVRNGIFKITVPIYIQQTVTQEQFVSGEYFYKVGQDYLEATEYSAEEQYYIRKYRTIFSADKSGNLQLEGSGTFKGDIYAESGTFKGTVNAEAGIIGNFNLNDGSLTSTKTDESGNPYIILNGESGEIIAKTIKIGKGATIEDYIALGKYVRLRTPTEDDLSFINVIDKGGKPVMELTAVNENGEGGEIKLGDNAIVLNGGVNGSEPFIEGENWFITPKLAQFSNVNITGAIKAASFEYGVVQSVGGMLFVRPSSKIKNIDGVNIYFETSQSGGFEVNDWCLLQTSDYSKFYYRVSSILKDNNLVIGLTLKTDVNEEISIDTGFIGATLINLGRIDDEDRPGSVGIGINGSTSDVFLAPNAISVVTPNWDDNAKTMKLNSHIVLGKLPDEEIYGYAAGTYGLYADNVVLKGQITTGTKTIERSYCGLGTIGETASVTDIVNYEDMFPDKKVGKIVLWAGAEKHDAIAQANFFVDEYGNIFANSGYFKGTIISESTIEAAEIKTAIITGSGPDGNGLIIRDVSTGIDFQDKDEDSYFKLSTKELKIGLPTIIEKNVSISGQLTVSQVLTKDNLSISSNLIQRDGAILKIGKPIVSTMTDDLASTQSAFDFAIGQDKVFQLNSEEVSIWGNVQYKNQNNEVVYEYRKATDEDDNIIGCDIFVYE